jgi:putative hydrolase of the HAD superfamily|tara:strand:+ start:7639 stop:8358 length:720 start_codon:yes stop_codon:yes gene_type:complete
MIPAAILFDLDDTILAPGGGDNMKVWMESVEKHIHLFHGLTPQDLFDEIRLVADEFWSDPDRHRTGRLNIRRARQQIVGKAAGNLNRPNDGATTKLANHYHNRRESDAVPFEGALETLSHFRDKPIKTALITNGSADTQRSKIDRFQLDQYFDLILIEGEFGVGKPDPGVYLHIVRELGVTADESWIVGDNLEWEVRAPQELGFFAIWVDHRKEGLPHDGDVIPNKIVNSIHELIDMVA